MKGRKIGNAHSPQLTNWEWSEGLRLLAILIARLHVDKSRGNSRAENNQSQYSKMPRLVARGQSEQQ